MESTEYAYRIETKRVKEENFPYTTEPMSTPLTVVTFARNLQDSDIEKMLVLFLDTKNKLICLNVTTGTVNQSVVYPREVIKLALLTGAVQIILVHNHPSGDPHPSLEDKNITRKIQDAARLLDISILDHIIIGESERYLSFLESGLL